MSPTPPTQSASPSPSSNLTGAPDKGYQNTHHIQDAAAGGIIAGAVIASVLGTFLLTFLWMRSRRGKPGNYRSTPDPHVERDVKTSEPKNVDNYLPQSADDKTVSNKVSTLLDQIQLHVENFYRSSVSVSQETENELLVKFDSTCLPDSLISLLGRSRTALPLITHCLTNSIISSIVPDSNPERSFLPLEFVLLPHNLEATKSEKAVNPGKLSLRTMC